ncbi:MAG TPA: hypothetical protein DDX39_09750 [Bacteroidales bacterium]|nr:MAG: hypothetical protein A2W98_01625 [Bacteroidetes bacterium GWF2_33_38]OFY85857.1 MAG: hypothetical protein A2236_03575 [Bacteroidetes bacterium RIFOXYA2_FULL_33_7]HBF88912.1 hypothetical protein [Bacteroidales bacterium]
METKIENAKKNGSASKEDVKNISVNEIKVVKPEHVNKETVSSATTEVKTKQKQFLVSPVAEIKPQLTLEQKIEKVENLKTLIEKREKLEASRKKLASFVVGANQFSENIVLTDESGNTFKTSNSEVFAKVVEAINGALVSKISEIENQIEF